MSRSRCYVGYFGVRRDTIHRFTTAFTEGTIYRPFPSDAVKVKIQPTFHGDIQTVIDTLCASNGAKFLTKHGDFLIFYKAREDENDQGSD